MTNEPPDTFEAGRFRLDEEPDTLARRLVGARCALCGSSGFVVELDPESGSVTRGLVRVRAGHICPDCVREAIARYARMARRIASQEE
jgi:hypothetical protein